MQEEVENRTVNLAVSTSRLTSRAVISAVKEYLDSRKKSSYGKERVHAGKQTVKELIGQGEGVTSIDIAKTALKRFERVAGRYGINYALRKDVSSDSPRYLVFFKAKDADAMSAAFSEYSRKEMKREERPGVIEQLRRYGEIAASLSGRMMNRDKKRELIR